MMTTSLTQSISHFSQKHQRSLEQSLQKIASGKRINKSADDASGLSISTRMNAQLRSQSAGRNNIQQTLSLLQTTEGAMSSIVDHLQRMRELALLASNGTYAASDRQSFQQEWKELQSSIDAISKTTMFNGKQVLRPGGGFKFNGLNQNILIGDNSNLNTGFTKGITLEAWGMQTAYSNNEDSWLFDKDYTGYRIWGLDKLQFGVRSPSQNWITIAPNFKPELNKWYHITGVVDNEKLKMSLYINGKLEKEIKLSSPILFGDYPGSGDRATIGSHSGQSRYWDGEVDELRIYKAPLTAQEIKDNYNGYVKNDHLAGQWLFDDGSIRDTTGLNGTATIKQAQSIPTRETFLVNTGTGGKNFSFTLEPITLQTLGIATTNITDSMSVESIDKALEYVTGKRASIGATMNALTKENEFSLSSTSQLTQANSRIEDADIAVEVSSLTKEKTMLEVSFSLLAEVHVLSSSLLPLLQPKEGAL